MFKITRLAPPHLSKYSRYPPPECKNCKYSVPKLNGEQMVCKLFGSFEQNGLEPNITFYLSTEGCRSHIDLCGPDGMYFKPK